MKENSKAFCKHIRSKRANRQRIGSLSDQRGNLCAELGIWVVPNEYFLSVFTKRKETVDGNFRERGQWYNSKKGEMLDVKENIKSR